MCNFVKQGVSPAEKKKGSAGGFKHISGSIYCMGEGFGANAANRNDKKRACSCMPASALFCLFDGSCAAFSRQGGKIA